MFVCLFVLKKEHSSKNQKKPLLCEYRQIMNNKQIIVRQIREK